MNNKQKIFITGISSEIMQRLVSIVDFANFDIYGLSRNPYKIKIQGIKLIKGGILDESSYKQALKGSSIIIHAAAETHNFNESEYYKTNYEGTKALVNAVHNKADVRFVYISSNTASENGGAYAKSKLLSEQLVQSKFNNHVILRLSEVYGGSKKEGIEKLIDDVSTKRFIPCPTGMKGRFRPIHIDDAVKMIFSYTFRDEDTYGIFGINGNKAYTYAELVEAVKKASGCKPRIIYISPFVMNFIKNTAKLLPFNIGVLPDQIERLYGDKYFQEPEVEFSNIEEYVSRKGHK